MKKVLLGFSLIMFITLSGYCQGQPQDLQLSIKSDAQVYVIGEEIKLKLVFRNMSSEQVTIYKEILPTYNVDFYISITTPEGDTYKPFAAKIKRKLSMAYKTMYQDIFPGQECGLEFLFNDYLALFDSMPPGVYKIKAQYSNSFDTYQDADTKKLKRIDAYKGSLLSNTLTLRLIQADISKEKAIEIAKEYALEEKERNLVYFNKITVNYYEDDDAWDVSFMMDPTPPGGYFDVIIDVQSGEVLGYNPGE